LNLRGFNNYFKGLILPLVEINLCIMKMQAVVIPSVRANDEPIDRPLHVKDEFAVPLLPVCCPRFSKHRWQARAVGLERFRRLNDCIAFNAIIIPHGSGGN